MAQEFRLSLVRSLRRSGLFCLPCPQLEIATGRHGEQNKPECRNERTNDKRNSWAIARDESAGPTGKKENHENQWEGGRTCCSCRVCLDLDEVQREQEEEDSNRGIEEECEQVGASEAA